MRVISLVNQKGGVGKTTTTKNLGAGLVREGKRVLLIDLDPQANLTYSLGIRPENDETLKTLYEVLKGTARAYPQGGITTCSTRLRLHTYRLCSKSRHTDAKRLSSLSGGVYPATDRVFSYARYEQALRDPRSRQATAKPRY